MSELINVGGPTHEFTLKDWSDYHWNRFMYNKGSSMFRFYTDELKTNGARMSIKILIKHIMKKHCE